MKIAVFGASGRTGKLVVEQALAAGHEVRAYVRSLESMPFEHDHLKIIVGELHDLFTLKQAIAGVDVCVSTLGGRSISKHAHVFMDGVRNIVAVMEQEGVKRLIYMSSVGASESRFLLSPIARFLIVRLLLRVPLADHTVNEQCIFRSNLDYTVLRPGDLSENSLTSDICHGSDKTIIKGSPTISRANVADFIVKQFSDTNYIRQSVWMYE